MHGKRGLWNGRSSGGLPATKRVGSVQTSRFVFAILLGESVHNSDESATFVGGDRSPPDCSRAGAAPFGGEKGSS